MCVCFNGTICPTPQNKSNIFVTFAGRHKSVACNGGYRNGQVDITVFFVTISQCCPFVRLGSLQRRSAVDRLRRSALIALGGHTSSSNELSSRMGLGFS